MKKLVSHIAHKCVRITWRGLLAARCASEVCSVWRKSHGNSQHQLFDTVAQPELWHDGCLAEPTMDHA